MKKQHTSFPSPLPITVDTISFLPPFLFFSANLMGGKYLIFVLIYISLITSEEEYFFMSYVFICLLMYLNLSLSSMVAFSL